jgi:hypothetical protein
VTAPPRREAPMRTVEVVRRAWQRGGGEDQQQEQGNARGGEQGWAMSFTSDDERRFARAAERALGLVSVEAEGVAERHPEDLAVERQ